MKNLTDTIVILFFKDSSVDYIDTVQDAETSYGCLTWRRDGQDLPAGAEVVYTFNVKDVHDDNTSTFVERITELNHGIIREDEVIVAAKTIYRSIRNAMPLGNGWGYYHSVKYGRLLVENKLREEQLTTGNAPLASWEEELISS